MNDRGSRIGRVGCRGFVVALMVVAVTLPQTVGLTAGSVSAAAPIAFRAQATSNANATRHSVKVPASVRAGDALLLFFAENTLATISGPIGVTGWKKIGTVRGGVTSRVWRKVAVAGDAGKTVTVTLSAQSKASLTVAAWSGTSTVEPVYMFQRLGLSDNSAFRTTPTIEVRGDVDQRLSQVVLFWAHKDSVTTSLIAPNYVTTLASGTQSGGGHVTTLIAQHFELVGAGDYEGVRAQAQAASSSATVWSFVLVPPDFPCCPGWD